MRTLAARIFVTEWSGLVFAIALGALALVISSSAFLTAQGERYGFSVDTAPPLEDEGRPVSSSSIRAALAEGRVVEAAELLGYPWFVSGEVVE